MFGVSLYDGIMGGNRQIGSGRDHKWMCEPQVITMWSNLKLIWDGLWIFCLKRNLTLVCRYFAMDSSGFFLLHYNIIWRLCIISFFPKKKTFDSSMHNVPIIPFFSTVVKLFSLFRIQHMTISIGNIMLSVNITPNVKKFSS